MLCPWSHIEHLIYNFKDNNNEDNYLNIVAFIKNNSKHPDFWIDIFYIYDEYLNLQRKYKHMSKEFSKIEDENEYLYSILYSNDCL